jgi:transposase
MQRQVYWLSDEEWRRIEPLLPRGRRGAHRVDDRRVISGIVHMLRSGARWRDCPVEYGPYTTIYNRFNRWSRQGIWLDMFKALTGSTSHNGSFIAGFEHGSESRAALRDGSQPRSNLAAAILSSAGRRCTDPASDSLSHDLRQGALTPVDTQLRKTNAAVYRTPNGMDRG